ncbi:stage II sporulation protein D [Siminovitchia terrae]|uniref:Stage II sporulation protein D n=1 Tax=Siminovitchia terrae TaxID=1914933 RepID=A0A429XCB9_SIMTE|nr:stage II sporulation protein D [Siminovitchia terrae]RST60999.1 stage II sporulation protein D [Siminovitchia terrae]GIN90862.1 stage II sporulation protein D [Siminovitchia terrae]
MKQLKPLLFTSALLIAVSFLVPSLLVLPFSKEKTTVELDEQPAKLPPKKTAQPATQPSAEVAVYRTTTKSVEKLPLEEYVVGVVASEMPADFEEEALKAQALTARTYIVNQLVNPENSQVPENANVTDTVLHQVFKNKKELKLQWGKDFEWRLEKIVKAVKATEGKVLTYHNKPITASFFSTSNGYTESAEDYWDKPVPYLKSVESPWDSHSPKFNDQKVISVKEFQQRLNVNIEKSGDVGTITARTPGKKVAAVTIGGKSFTGREVREKLDLKSTDFKWERKGNSIIINTKGYGHGVGMSQYGANGMAKEGKKFDDIVTHYYQGVSISNASQFFDKTVASTQ